MSRVTTNTDLRRRRAGIALACLTLALALNAAALAVADGASALALPALAPVAREARPTLLLIAPRTPSQAPTRANTFAHAEKSTAPPRRSTAVTRVPVATAVPMQLAAPRSPDSEDAALRFFRIGELDKPPSPPPTGISTSRRSTTSAWIASHSSC